MSLLNLATQWIDEELVCSFHTNCIVILGLILIACFRKFHSETIEEIWLRPWVMLSCPAYLVLLTLFSWWFTGAFCRWWQSAVKYSSWTFLNILLWPNPGLRTEINLVAPARQYPLIQSLIEQKLVLGRMSAYGLPDILTTHQWILLGKVLSALGPSEESNLKSYRCHGHSCHSSSHYARGKLTLLHCSATRSQVSVWQWLCVTMTTTACQCQFGKKNLRYH